MSGKLYCDVLQLQLNHFTAQMPKRIKILFHRVLAHWYTSNIVKEKIANLKLDVLNWVSKKARFKFNRDAMVYSR